jgi:multidrug efflux pump subunit AcrA (membrane-fusion protein)
MKPGQRVRSTLHLEERKAALAVPRQAVFEREGRTIVYRKKGRQQGGGFEPVEVKLGPSGAGRVVVESGVAAGDRLALIDPTRPADEVEEEEQKSPAAPAAPGAAPR